MAVAGIDAGALATKVVILHNDKILAATTLESGESGENEAGLALDEALKQAGLTKDDVNAVVATGAGRAGISFADKQRSSMSCIAKGAYFLFPQARTVVDAGAESSTAIRLSDEGSVEDSIGNDKCAAGGGMFLNTMSKMLRVPLDELGPQSLKATEAEPISSMCVVFAESEVVSLVHRDPPVPLPNILAGIHESMADRMFGLVQRVSGQGDVVMTGGLSKNIGFIRAMEAKLGKTVLVPTDPQIVGALGAALVAQASL